MITQTSVTLQSGESLSLVEIYEGLALLAISNGPPLLTQADAARAFAEVAFEAMDWFERERGFA